MTLLLIEKFAELERKLRGVSQSLTGNTLSPYTAGQGLFACAI